uniref:glycerophosphodiester phosphodiesterase domain-containing protein 5-like n=1 Tax=Ciona intestinalis TaxID=7719 RepID=UPI000180BAFB|nr:glycerophosphodiester phosphodiesterase domain-containing protein 5-like [Ciona intestinalis]|eukprot:XP_009861753.2 glycerophosphodiester phosphodiesterase domain-containing protein 5-like [Ciona intestinalis]
MTWQSMTQQVTLFILFVCSLGWYSVSNDYVVFDNSLFDYVHIWMCWSRIIHYLISSVFIYLLYAYSYSQVCNVKTTRFQNVLFNLSALIATPGFAAIILIWSPELQTVKLFFQFFSPCIHLSLMLFSTLLLCCNKKSSVFKRNFTIPFFSILFFTMLTFFIHPRSPCVSDVAVNRTKPLIFGHKGFPMIAPENTELSFQLSLEYVDGFETDVAVSYDGVPFLIHDRTLKRTSNVEDVFPDRKHERAEMFTWGELQKLDVGTWFIRDHPYHIFPSNYPEEIRQRIKQQKLMSLNQLAVLAAEHGKYMIFDLRMPPMGHPHAYNYIHVIIDAVLSSGIKQSQVFWVLGPYADYVTSKAPGFNLVYGAKVNHFSKYTMSGLILEYNTVSGEEIQSYKEKQNMDVILYTSSTEWTFSLAWCQGAFAYISDDPKIHSQLNKPIFLFTVREYNNIWRVCFIFCCICIFLSSYIRTNTYFKPSR